MSKFYLLIILLVSIILLANCSDKEENIISADTDHPKPVLTLQKEKGIYSISTQSKESGFFAGGAGNPNLYISMDEGENWSIHSAIPPQYTVTKIVRSMVDQDLLLLAYHDSEASVTNETSTGLLLSTTNGDRWIEIQHPFNKIDGEYFYWFAGISFANDNSNNLFALTKVNTSSGGIRLYKSEDLGSSWSILKTFSHGSPGVPDLRRHPTNPKYLYVSAPGYPGSTKTGFISKDQGVNWTTLEKVNEGNIFIYSISTDGVIYAVLYSRYNYDPQYLVRSNDDGQSWQVLFEEEEYSLVDVDTYGNDVVVVLVRSDKNSNHSIRYSLDNGNSWNNYSPSIDNRETFGYPDKIEILNYDNEAIDILAVWNGDYLRGGRSQIWKMKIIHSL